MPKAALVRHGCASHGVLQARYGPVVAGCASAIAGVLAVVLDECIEFGAAGVQDARKIERNVGQVVRMRFSKFISPITEELAFVGALLWHFYGIFVHLYF